MNSDVPRNSSREIKCKLGVLSRSDGSAILSEGATTVAAACYGPVETKMSKILIDKVNVEVHYRPKSGLPGIGDRLHETIIKDTCEMSLITSLYPRASVIIVIQEMQNRGGLLSCAINAACLALLDSGIDMRFLVAAVTCVLCDNNELVLDSNLLKIQNSKAQFVFVFNSNCGELITSHTSGTYSIQEFEAALELCRKGSVEVFEFYRTSMKEKYK